MQKLIITLAIILYPCIAFGADVTLTWDVSTGATGYKVYMSADAGKTWGIPRDAGSNTKFIWLGAPNTGLVLFRVSAYNASSEVVKTEAGVWYCGSWKGLTSPQGVGVE